MHGSITIDIRGDLGTVLGPPNQNLVNPRAIQHDLDKLGISIQKLDSLLQGQKRLAAEQAENSRKARQSTEKLQEYFKKERRTQKPPKNYRSAIKAHMNQYLDNAELEQNLSISKPKMLMLMNPNLDLKVGQIIFISKVSFQAKEASSGDIQKRNFIYAFRGEKIIRVKEVE